MTQTRIDRNDLLRRTDLPHLLDQISGPARQKRWRCPSPTHDDRRPSVTVLHRDGIGRWRCWSCDAHGTAIDLMVITQDCGVAEAIRRLAEDAQVEPVKHPEDPLPAAEPHPSVERYVAAAARILFSRTGHPVLRWLVEERGLSPEVLAVNRVGADPGPKLLRRKRGLPSDGMGAVLPSFDTEGELSYCQTRFLEPTGPKYQNPVGRLAPNPRVSWPITPDPGSDRLVVCEGVVDGLTCASAGYRAVAVLGASYPSNAMGELLAATGREIVVAFDGDEAGQVGAARLADLVGGAQIVALPAGEDLNDVAKHTPLADLFD